MILAKVLLVAVLGSVAAMPTCERLKSPTVSADDAERQSITAALEPKQAPRSVVATIEARADLVFNSGQHTLSPDGRRLLQSMLAEQPHNASLRIEVFCQRHKRHDPIHDLSAARAAAIRKYLASSDGGRWCVDQAIGRGYDIENDRAADRRIVISVLGE